MKSLAEHFKAFDVVNGNYVVKINEKNVELTPTEFVAYAINKARTYDYTVEMEYDENLVIVFKGEIDEFVVNTNSKELHKELAKALENMCKSFFDGIDEMIGDYEPDED